MNKLLQVRPLGLAGQVGDLLMLPLMHLIMFLMVGSWKAESPQQTHRWNNKKFQRKDIRFPAKYLLTVRGIAKSGRAPSLFRHIPFTGWRNYVVLAPKNPDITSWHVGWAGEEVVGLSRIPLHGAVRMLQGPEPVDFYGVDLEDGSFVPLYVVGYGQLGDGSLYAQIPLL